jgi:hypothetical protein
MMGKVLSVAVLLASLLALYNVYGDNTELLERAERLACGNRCVRLLRAQRTPIEQSFTFQTSLQPARTLDVHCRRALLLIGDYACSPSP